MININSLNRILLFSIFNISFMFIFLQKKNKNIMNLSERSRLDKELFLRKRSLYENTEDKSVQTDLIIENKEIQTNFIIMNNSIYNDYYDIIDEEGNLFVIL